MNNNPFEPVTTEPGDGNPPLTDNAADDFTANSNAGPDLGNLDDTPKAPLSIDGISPSYNDMSADNDTTPKILKIDETGDSKILDTTPTDILTDDHAADFLNDTLPDDSVTPSDNSEPIVPIAKNEEPAVESAPVAVTAPPPTDVKPAKPAKHVTISLLTIIFFVLAIIGIAGAVWFFIQNNKNANALADSKAKVQQLEDELSTSATAENTTSGQYEGLNDKIEDLTDKNSEGQKTLDETKKKNDELTKQVTDLTTQNAKLTKEAADISTLKTGVDKMLSEWDKSACKPLTP
jgi:flagellar basal body-associated protein FliL